AIHHINLDAVGAAGLRGLYLLAQAGEIGGENRGDDQRHGSLLSTLHTVSWWGASALNSRSTGGLRSEDRGNANKCTGIRLGVVWHGVLRCSTRGSQEPARGRRGLQPNALSQTDSVSSACVIAAGWR